MTMVMSGSSIVGYGSSVGQGGGIHGRSGIMSGGGIVCGGGIVSGGGIMGGGIVALVVTDNALGGHGVAVVTGRGRRQKGSKSYDLNRKIVTLIICNEIQLK